MFRSVVLPISRHLGAVAAASCMTVLLFASGSAHAQGLFQAPSSVISVGTTPQGVATADLALSGYQSLVVTSSASNNIKVFLGTGSGTFASALTYSTCTRPTAVTTLDVNQDGYPDIAVICPTTNRLNIFVNQGATNPGNFSAAASYTVSSPAALVAANFRRTTGAGLAVVTSTGVSVYNFVGGTPTTSTISVSGSLTGVVAADLNHDGNLDLAISDNTNNNVHVLTGNGAGTFTPLGTYSTGSATKPGAIVAADFNNDGNIDVATANKGNNTVTVLLGSTSGALTAQTPVAAGTNPVTLLATDINSDGNPDLVAFDAGTTTGAVAVLLGNGDGTLQTAQSSSLSFVPGNFAFVRDFNRDGKPDIAITQQNTNRVSLLLNNTLPTQYLDGRSLSSANSVGSGNGNMADSISAGDFNQDGKADIATAYLADNAVRVMLNTGTGFGAAVVYSVGKQPYSVSSGDLNGDGYPDLVTANTGDNTISVLLNKGKTGYGTFNSAVTYNVGTQPFQAAIGDVNGDGYPDLAVTNYGANTVSILFGSAAGTFTPASTLTLATGCSPYGAAIADFAHTGYSDVAVTCNQSSQLYVFPNNGNGTFGTPFISSTDTGAASLVVGDFNRDGKLDIVTGNTLANDISFFAGYGNGTFAAAVTGESLNFPATIAAADFNGDGILDIIGVAPNFNAVELTLGVGDGTFGSFQDRHAGQFTNTKQPWGIAVADFNNDGKPDVVTANTYNQVNLASPAYQARYLGAYPAIPGGNPSVNLLYNTSGTQISLSTIPASPLPYNNTNTTINATVQPTVSGVDPTGSVTFEDSTGAVLGSGPYALSGGVATYNVGHLGSGSYLFTSLYSGDVNYQPNTASGSGFVISVSGAPVTLTLTPSSVDYYQTFTAGVTVTGTAGSGVPTGNAKIYTSTGTLVGTINTLTATGNNSTGSVTITANAPNFNVGTYQLYAVYTPTNGNYQAGSSAYQTLTVSQDPVSVSTQCADFLTLGFCNTAVAASYGPTLNSGTVTYTITGDSQSYGPTPVALTNGNAYLAFPFGQDGSGSYTVSAAFVPTSTNYASGTATTSVNCLYLFGFPIGCYGSGANARATPLQFNPFAAQTTQRNSFNRFLMF